MSLFDRFVRGIGYAVAFPASIAAALALVLYFIFLIDHFVGKILRQMKVFCIVLLYCLKRKEINAIIRERFETDRLSLVRRNRGKDE